MNPDSIYHCKTMTWAEVEFTIEKWVDNLSEHNKICSAIALFWSANEISVLIWYYNTTIKNNTITQLLLPGM